MTVCDGCGAPADADHIRLRIERLERATRFRPIHVQVLLLNDAPPGRPEDYFYFPQAGGAARSRNAKAFFEETLISAGIPREASANEEAALAEFQHRGFYLADAVECPVSTEDELHTRLSAAAPTVVKRIEFSYRPKRVVPVGSGASQLLSVLQKSNVADRILAVDVPAAPNGTAPAFGEHVAAALSRQF